MEEGAKWGQEAAFEPRNSQQKARSQPTGTRKQADRQFLDLPASAIKQFTPLSVITPHFQALFPADASEFHGCAAAGSSPAPPPRLLAKATATVPLLAVPLPLSAMTRVSIYQQCQRHSTSSRQRGLSG